MMLGDICSFTVRLLWKKVFWTSPPFMLLLGLVECCFLTSIKESVAPPMKPSLRPKVDSSRRKSAFVSRLLEVLRDTSSRYFLPYLLPSFQPTRLFSAVVFARTVLERSVSSISPCEICSSGDYPGALSWCGSLEQVVYDDVFSLNSLDAVLT